MVAVKILVFCVFLTAVSAEPIEVKRCSGDAGRCKISALRISPCAEAASKTACKLQLGKIAGVEFDYTTDFDAPSFTTQVYVTTTDFELPLSHMEKDSCLSTPCPVVKQKQHTFSNFGQLPKDLPINTYNLKWRMIADEQEGKECCFLFSVQLVP